MSAESAATLLTSWLGTYLVHSTILLGAAWVATAAWRRLGLGLRETLWRTALLGGVVTATAQMALGLGPRVETPEALEGASRVTAVRTEPAEIAGPAAPTSPVSARAPSLEALVEPPARPPPVPAPEPEREGLAGLVLVLVGAGALLGAVRWRRAAGRLRRAMSGRSPIVDGPLRRALDGLIAAAGRPGTVRLSEQRGLGSPLARGILRPEICVPARTGELPPEQREALLAHELAHVVRRDALWLALGRLVGTVLWFQPLNRLAGHRLLETTELLCDRWAVGRTGRPRALAACLGHVATWLIEGRAAPVPTAMAQRGSLLRTRVRRLLDGPCPGRERRGPRILLPVVLLVATALAGPGLGARAGTALPEPSARDRPVVAVAPSASLEEALSRLDGEMTLLEEDLITLLPLLERLEERSNLSPRVERLARRLAVLRSRRGTLTKIHEETHAETTR